VAFHCLWALGFGTTSLRVVAHGVVGCLFYGAYAAKMLALRLPGLPGWTLPVLGGSVLASVALLWLTAALWFFTRPGIPLT
jgi:hypothetical protein